MAKKKSKTNDTATMTRGRPQAAPLPGMEDRAIKPLEDVAGEYANIRDERMDLTQREHALKSLALKLMKKYEKTIYRHDGIEITVVPGEDDVKVKVKKHDDTEAETGAAERGAEFADERRTAVADGD
jgi:hypothetical protein